jgi:hypothetical protein
MLPAPYVHRHAFEKFRMRDLGCVAHPFPDLTLWHAEAGTSVSARMFVNCYLNFIAPIPALSVGIAKYVSQAALELSDYPSKARLVTELTLR